MESKYILLTGAGYTKNWGGWLASELWAVILGHPLVQQNPGLKAILWEYRMRGFEEVFGDGRIDIKQYQKIVKDSFVKMHKTLKDSSGEFNWLIYEKLLNKFSVIFTLNQDLFFEVLHPVFQDLSNKYYYPHVKSRSYFQYGLPRHVTNSGVLELDSLMLDATLIHNAEPYNQTHNPLAFMSSSAQAPKPLPYYKLHGSLNFKDGDKDILIMGGSKPEQIEKIPLINQYHQDFDEILQNTKKLMVIGYSFLDYHINQKIFAAIENNNLKFWIIDVSDLEKLMENAINTEIKNNNPEIIFIEPRGFTSYSIEKKREHCGLIKAKYEELFRKGLVSATKDSLHNIFTSNSLELDRINEQFFT